MRRLSVAISTRVIISLSKILTKWLPQNADVKVHPRRTKDSINPATSHLPPYTLSNHRASLHEEKERHARVPTLAHGVHRALMEQATREERAKHEPYVAK